MAKKEKEKSQKKPNLAVLIPAVSISVLILAGILIGYLYFLDKIYPGISVGDTGLTGLTKPQVEDRLARVLMQRTASPLKFTYQNQEYQVDLSPITQSENFSALSDKAFSFGHKKVYYSPITLSFRENLFDPIEPQLQTIAQGINQPSVDSRLKVNGDQINATPSQNGLGLDEDKLKQSLVEYLNTGVKPETELPVKTLTPKLSYTSAMEIKKTLDRIKISPVKLVYKTQSFDLDLPTILSLIDLGNSKSTLISGNLLNQSFEISDISVGQNNVNDIQLTLNQNKLSDYLKTLSAKINQPVEEPLLNFDQSGNAGKGKVTQFRPPQEGRSLDISAASKLISDRLLSENLTTIPLPVTVIEPKNKLVNDLGIKDLLGEGVSHFYHSTTDRIFNLELAASRVNGTLIAPGDTFSFDATVGDISAASGYHQGYVIESGKTVLDDGGGVCQDPTTLFRAVLNAGLPVVSRTAHAYRVGYYEENSPPGLDATIFSPSVDFKFKNDTSAYILVQAHADDANYALYYDLYGTSDGRTAHVSTPVILSTSPALPDIRQDDPTLPVGTVKQVDFAVGGANVVFSRTVTRDGQTLIQETYHSNYRPWQNVYLVGTKT